MFCDCIKKFGGWVDDLWRIMGMGFVGVLFCIGCNYVRILIWYFWWVVWNSNDEEERCNYFMEERRMGYGKER